MRRTITRASRTTATLALGCSTALGFAAVAQARSTHDSQSHAVMTASVSSCKIVVTGAPWQIRGASGNLTGNTYTLAARDISCSSVRALVVAFTHQAGTQPIKGPAGYTCQSFSTSSAGDTLLYSGVCMHPPHNHPFFEWGPKVPRP